jgi:KDO2-lipid IV(A) lauroyltransferase
MNFKNIRYLAEAVVVKFGLWIFYVMRPELASNVAATIAKFVGTKIPVHKLAYENISKAMPELSAQKKEKILDDMWDNLGRIVGEYPHVTKCQIEKIDQLVETSSETQNRLKELKQSGKGGIIFSAHIGNWEIGPKVLLRSGLKVSTVYRPLNNPYVEKMTAAIRGVNMIEKSAGGNRKIIEAIKKGDFVVIMADQKVSEGEEVKFFHEMAITTTSIARLALRYDIPLIPARSIRIGKEFRFRAEVEKPLAIKKSDDVNSDVLRLTREINLKLEEWVKEYPSQWFWVHNRWKK